MIWWHLLLTLYYFKWNFSEGNGGINAVEIRTQTDNREVFAVRRVFYHPLRDNNQRRLTYYYDLAILELGKQAKTLFFLYAHTNNVAFFYYLSERKILYDFEVYGDSPTCLNDKFDIANKDAYIQGFGVTNKFNANVEEKQLFEGQVVTVSNENCTLWTQANADELEFLPLPYGNGSTFGELKHGINKEILCSRGIVQADGVISVSIKLKY